MKTLGKQNFKFWAGIIVLLLTFTFLSGQQAQAGIITDSINSGVSWAKNNAEKTIGGLGSVNLNSIKARIPALNSSYSPSFNLNALSNGIGAQINKSRNFIQSNYLTQNNSVFKAMSSLSMANIIGGIGNRISAMGRYFGMLSNTGRAPTAGKAFVLTSKTLKIDRPIIPISNFSRNKF